MRRRSFLATPGALGLAGAPQAGAADAIDIGSRRELFVDRYLIEKLDGAELRLCRPVEAGPVLKLDKPWEGAFAGYFTVIRDRDVFHLYYRGLPNARPDGSSLECTCYARSSDGVHWTRPELGLFEVHGTRNNNVIWANDRPFSHNFAPFLDRRPGVPSEERFKAISGTMKTGLMGFVSADGVHWKKMRPEPVLPPSKASAYDSQNLAFWSETERKYLCYYRTFRKVEGMGNVRWISRAESDDFVNWQPGREMSFGDAPAEHLYTNQTSPYYRAPHISIAVAARFMPGRQVIDDAEASSIGVHPQYYKDCADGVLLTTRGGYRYDREFMEGFLRPGPGLGNWVSRDNYPAWNVVETSPEEMSLYVQRHYGQPSAYLSRFVLRVDGFAAVAANYKGGALTTRPLRFTGSTLQLNYATSAAGSVTVEIRRPGGEALPGFAREDCRELIGDRIARQVSWKGGDVRALAGQPVQLRFYLRDAEVFSYRFA